MKMESISNYSYEFDERQSNLKDPLLYSNSINTEDMIESEMNSSRKKSCTFVHTDTTSNLNNSSEVNISEFDSTSILIPSSIDSELQSAAQAFVEELIFRAQKEVNSKNLSKHKVRLIICRISMLYYNTQKFVDVVTEIREIISLYFLKYRTYVIINHHFKRHH